MRTMITSEKKSEKQLTGLKLHETIKTSQNTPDAPNP